MGKKPAPKTTVELIDEAAADPNLSPMNTLVALGRMVLHLGMHDPVKLKLVAPAIGNVALGMSKVASEGKKAGEEDDDRLLKAFVNAKR